MTPMELSGSINVLGYALATLGPAIGVAWIFASVINGTARQPEAQWQFRADWKAHDYQSRLRG